MATSPPSSLSVKRCLPKSGHQMWQERCGACLLFSVALLQARRHVLFISLSLPCSSRRALWHRPWLWRLHSRPPWLWPPRPLPRLPPSQCSRRSRALLRPPELLSCPRFVSLQTSNLPSYSQALRPQGCRHCHCHSCQQAGFVISSCPDPRPQRLTRLKVSSIGSLTHAHTRSRSYIHTSAYPPKDMQARHKGKAPPWVQGPMQTKMQAHIHRVPKQTQDLTHTDCHIYLWLGRPQEDNINYGSMSLEVPGSMLTVHRALIWDSYLISLSVKVISFASVNQREVRSFLPRI